MQKLNGSTLKIIAILSMLLDHFAAVTLNGIVLNAPYSRFNNRQFALLLQGIEICQAIGRIAFPIFCFLLVEGFVHTHNLRRYLLQMGIFALITEPVYDWALSGKLLDLGQQNVLFTLFLGLVTLIVIRKCQNNPFSAVILAGISGSLSYLLCLDGWYYGILLIVVFYMFRRHSPAKFLLALLVIYLCGLDYSLQALTDPSFFTAAFSLLLLALYNGKRGLHLKYFFYSFYPSHLLLLSALTNFLVIPLIK